MDALLNAPVSLLELVVYVLMDGHGGLPLPLILLHQQKDLVLQVMVDCLQAPVAALQSAAETGTRVDNY